MGDTFQLEQWSLVSPAMNTFLHVLALAFWVACLTANPVSEGHDEGSGDGPEIVINEVVEKNVDANEHENADEDTASSEDLLGMEMNPEDNEIKVNEKIGQDAGNKLDKKKCQKCIRAHYQARHADFCEKCEHKSGEEGGKPDETSQMSKPNRRCSKCARKNFRTRNDDFCSQECPSIEADHITKVHKKKENNKKMKNKDTEDENKDEAQTEPDQENVDVKVSNVEDNVEETTTEADSKMPHKKHTKKNKKHKHEKHRKKNKKNGEKVTEDTKTENDESSVDESEDEKKDTIKLGPLENLIRFLIKTNTYTH